MTHSIGLQKKRTYIRAAVLLIVVCGLLLTTFFSTIVHAQSRSTINAQAARDFKAAEAKLNQVYKRLTAQTDPRSLAKLKAAQRAWLAFRDAQAELHADLLARGDTTASTDYLETRAVMTQERAGELEGILHDMGR